MAKESFRQEFTLKDYGQAVLKDLESQAKDWGCVAQRENGRLVLESAGPTVDGDACCSRLQRILAKNKCRAVAMVRFVPAEGQDVRYAGISKSVIKKTDLAEVVRTWKQDLVQAYEGVTPDDGVLETISNMAGVLGCSTRPEGGVILVERAEPCPEDFILDVQSLLAMEESDCAVITGISGDRVGERLMVIDSHTARPVSTDTLVLEWTDRTYRELTGAK